MLASGQVDCWGRNHSGQLGNGTTDESSRRDRLVLPPTRVVALTDVAQVTTGDRFACARTHRGHVACWGNGDQGQLGVPDLTESLVPAWLELPSE